MYKRLRCMCTGRILCSVKHMWCGYPIVNLYKQLLCCTAAVNRVAESWLDFVKQWSVRTALQRLRDVTAELMSSKFDLLEQSCKPRCNVSTRCLSDRPHDSRYRLRENISGMFDLTFFPVSEQTSPLCKQPQQCTLTESLGKQWIVVTTLLWFKPNQYR